jgi:hypothetical protein
MKKLITFSLWGDDPKYTVGAIRNAELAERLYPDWTCRFYIGEHTPGSVEYQFLCQKSNVEYVQMPTGMEGWKGMFARFLPAGEDDVGMFISRDCDSRLSEREAATVEDWLKGPKLIHAMRDHPHHSVPILGGMWGAKRHAIPDIKEQIDLWTKEDRWQTDQEFLRDVIWPKHYHKVLAHDDWMRFRVAETRRILCPRANNDFIGAIIGPNEERLHPEHHEML